MTPKKKTEKPERTSIVYAEVDEELIEIYEKIKKCSSKSVCIVLPKKSAIFQSVVNLKLLKKRVRRLKKKIFIVTSDKNGLLLAETAGIKLYDKVSRESIDGSSSADIAPIKATINSVDEDAPLRLKEKKISISEILAKSKKGKKVRIERTKGTVKVKVPKKKKKRKSRITINTGNRQALIGFSAFSVFVLLSIVYIALPGATIIITPAASVLEKSVNITLADASLNPGELASGRTHMIASHPVRVESKVSVIHKATGKRFSERGANASGYITIMNEAEHIWPLVEETRFQNEEGLVFRIKEALFVPAAGFDGPGVLEAYVEADIEDALGAIVGARGNIGPSKFFLPALREDSREKIYAESVAQMEGGVTDFVTFVSEDDLLAAEAITKRDLEKRALQELKAEVAKLEAEDPEGREFVLLEDAQVLKMFEPEIEVQEQVLGEAVKSVTATGTIRAKSIYYERAAMLEILKEELLEKKSPQKELLRVNEKSTSYRIFELDDLRGKVKLTANIKGIEQYDIDEDKEFGRKLLGKIREHVVGENKVKALKFIQNLPEVNKVDVDSWPYWAPNLPSIADNIDFDVRDAALVN